MNQSRNYPARPYLATSAAVFREGRVLVAQRAAAPAAGSWSLPGGLVESGESLAAAAARELYEETGIEATILAPADIREVIDKDDAGAARSHFVIVAFAGRWRAGEARARDATLAVRWVSLEELHGIDLTEGTAEVIRHAAAIVTAEQT